MYGLGEIGFISSLASDFDVVGGTVDGVDTISTSINNTQNDFFVSWNKITLAPNSIAYSSASYPVVAWQTWTFSEFNIAAVPIPTALPLLLSGIAGLGLVGCKRQTA